MNDNIAINHIAFVWQTRREKDDLSIRENLLDKLDRRITIYHIGDYADHSFFYNWKINIRYAGDLRLDMQYPVLVIMQDGRPNISRYYSELKHYLKSGADLTTLADQINQKVVS